jgi:hypothetical protein
VSRAWLGVGVVLVVVAGFGVGRYYVDHRYTSLKDFTWARHVHDSRIAILNLLTQYQLYGADLSNHVQYVAHRDSHGRSASIASCRPWLTALRDGRYNYVVVSKPDVVYPKEKVPPAVGWTRSDPGAQLLLRPEGKGEGGQWVFELHGTPDPATCADAKP